MAVHPLRPATRRRLGRPLPHQQADRPRAHPTPQKLSTMTPTPWSYVVLDPVSQAYPTVRGRSPTCYSPVRHSSTHHQRWWAFPFDLHVLSTPPAFVLSQDQTLQPQHTLRIPHKSVCRAQNKNKNKINSVSSVYLLTRATHPHHYQGRGVRHPHNNNNSVGVCSTWYAIEFSHNKK